MPARTGRGASYFPMQNSLCRRVCSALARRAAESYRALRGFPGSRPRRGAALHLYPAAVAMTRPMLIRLSAITPSPTHLSIPSGPRYRLRFNPWRRFKTLIRPSQPHRQRCPFLNHLFFCSCRRGSLRVWRFGTATHFTPFCCTACSLAWE